LSSADIRKVKDGSRLTGVRSMKRFAVRICVVLLLAATLSMPTAARGQAPESVVNVVEIGGVETVFVNSSLISSDAAPDIRTWLDRGAPVVFYGDQPELLLDFCMPRIYVEGVTSDGSKLVALGVIAATGNRSGGSALRVMGRSFTEDALGHAIDWVEDCLGAASGSPSDGYERVGLLREVERHEPYGVVESTVDLVRGWSWLEYLMNGSAAGANVYLSDYDQPPSGETPAGLFSFLWRIMTFRWDEAFPWLRDEPVVRGVDMSDFSRELFMVRYENSGDTGAQFTVRHRYVLRVGEGQAPMFWHQTQIRYAKGVAFNVERHITPPMLDGLVKVNP